MFMLFLFYFHFMYQEVMKWDIHIHIYVYYYLTKYMNNQEPPNPYVMSENAVTPLLSSVKTERPP